MTEPNYWLPPWWGWMQDWGGCIECLKYNHSACLSCEIPPGVLALAQLVGGGTAAVAGSMRGNTTIASGRQAQAATRQHGAQAVENQLSQQKRELNLNVNANVNNDLIGNR